MHALRTSSTVIGVKCSREDMFSVAATARLVLRRRWAGGYELTGWTGGAFSS